MGLEERVEAVNKINKALSKSSGEEAVQAERVTPANKERFDALMTEQQTEQKESKQVAKAGDSTSITKEAVETKVEPLPSLMDEVQKLNHKVNQISNLTPEDLKNQARGIVAQIEEVKTQLAQAQEIKPSYQKLIHNRLTHVDDSLKIALSKAGVEYAAVQPESKGLINPIQRFLGYLTHGQYQLEHLEQTIEQMNLKDMELSPMRMLAIQIKLGQVQQEIELCTSCLNKALESTKTLMNVQV